MLAEPRIWSLGALAAGLALSPLTELQAGTPEVAVALGCLCLLLAMRPRAGALTAWIGALVVCGLVGGSLLGGARLAAIDGAAYSAKTGEPTEVRGYVAAPPGRSDGIVRIPVQSPEGRLLVQAPEPIEDLAPGALIEARGTVRAAPEWSSETLRRQGISHVLEARELRRLPGRRQGFHGWLDGIRNRAAAALTEGMEKREGALALGFVLGQDDRIDPLTEERFRRSGLAHLLAVSGQNVLLLVLLASPVLALAGLGLRARLWVLLALIAIYVPLAGGGASIQRAGVMGATGLVALLGGRPSSRVFAMVAAAAVTLALNPRASGDVGWQLSFAAVAGIFLLAPPLRRRLTERLDGGRLASAAAEGVAVTLAATIATAPISAFHFGTLSLASLIANVAALPAVAPAMWIGMAVAALAQLPSFPAASLNGLNELLLGYIAQVAAWLGDPAWAQASVELESPVAAVAALMAALGGCRLLLAAAERRSPRRRERAARGTRRRAPAVLAAGLVAGFLALWSGTWGGDDSAARGLRVVVLDVGQGDAILLAPPEAPPILVDAGPPDGDAAELLRDEGVSELAAAVVTHDQSDHAGGLGDVLSAMPVDRLVFNRAGEDLIGAARAAGSAPTWVAEGSEIRSGSLRLEVLWPPRELGAHVLAGEDPNARSLVLLARWHRFEMLLTGDAEAETVPLDPGPIDVLKVSHHGSEDAGLGDLLDRTAPRLAVISVGASNSYGHPTPQVLEALDAHGVPVLRTDEEGSVEVGVSGGRIRVLGAT